MGRKRFDHTGIQYGRLLVVEEVPSATSNPRWDCLCDCGKKIVVTSSNLKSGNTQSCGCLKKEKITTHGKSYSRLMTIYRNMITRCYNPKSTAYANYGGKGIVVSEEWRGCPNSFFKWAEENGYSPELTLDRINGNTGYSPTNCRWATRKIQARNQKIKESNQSGFRGVHFAKNVGKYTSQIKLEGKSLVIGYAPTAEEAAQLRDEYIRTHSLVGFKLASGEEYN